MLKTIIISLTLTMTSCGAYAARHQIISMPDGTQMVCWYFPSGYVDCQNL